MDTNLVVAETIKGLIFTIRGQRVMIDRDLASLYEVEVKTLNRAVKRNIERFPEFFMFQLTEDEWRNLRCQFGTTKISEKSRYKPYVFTEQGVAMLSSVLNSPKAIQINDIYKQLNYLADITRPQKIGFKTEEK
ncbi:MAG: ORF6N domain-containing protein [Heliobacteriaceae bacterium]|jgi:hypothetical protein|nr:ORF6N domain-containing protein [Heliobacteriaceae bacterium]